MKALSQAARSLYKKRRNLNPARQQQRAPTGADGKKGARLYASLSKDADTNMRKELLACASVWADEKNGRWRIKFKDVPGARRSISWTNVSAELGALIVLKQCWDWAEAYAGAQTLAHLQAAFDERIV